MNFSSVVAPRISQNLSQQIDFKAATKTEDEIEQNISQKFSKKAYKYQRWKNSFDSKRRNDNKPDLDISFTNSLLQPDQ